MAWRTNISISKNEPCAFQNIYIWLHDSGTTKYQCHLTPEYSGNLISIFYIRCTGFSGFMFFVGGYHNVFFQSHLLWNPAFLDNTSNQEVTWSRKHSALVHKKEINHETMLKAVEFNFICQTFWMNKESTNENSDLKERLKAHLTAEHSPHWGPVF